MAGVVLLILRQFGNLGLEHRAERWIGQHLGLVERTDWGAEWSSCDSSESAEHLRSRLSLLRSRLALRVSSLRRPSGRTKQPRDSVFDVAQLTSDVLGDAGHVETKRTEAPMSRSKAREGISESGRVSSATLIRWCGAGVEPRWHTPTRRRRERWSSVWLIGCRRLWTHWTNTGSRPKPGLVQMLSEIGIDLSRIPILLT
jgi:hypothetical protein